MLRKVLSVFGAMLLLASLSGTSAMPMKCGTMAPEECKKDMAMRMDTMTMMKMTEMMRMAMMKMATFWNGVMGDMPNTSMHTKTIMRAMHNMKMEMAMMDRMTMMRMMEMMKMDMMRMMDTMMKMEGMDATQMTERMNKMKMNMGMMDKMTKDMMTPEMMKTMIQESFMWMHPDFKMSQTEDKANMEKFNEVMKKHGSPEDMIAKDQMMMMNELGKMWVDMANGLSEEDAKMYPKMAEVKEMLTKMMANTNLEEKMEMFINAMKTMTETNDMPFVKAMMMATMSRKKE